MHLIREVLDKESRYFLLKQGRDSVVARADFSAMPEILSVLSGRAETFDRWTACAPKWATIRRFGCRFFKRRCPLRHPIESFLLRQASLSASMLQRAAGLRSLRSSVLLLTELFTPFRLPRRRFRCSITRR